MPQVVILPHVIEQKLQEDERQEVIDFINGLVSNTSSELKRDIIEIVEERFEGKLSRELVNQKLELLERISSSEVRLNEKITTATEKLRSELVEKIANSKADTIKWMFIFWIGNVLTIIGGILGILKIAKVF
jgi:hypothetical protein